MTFNIKGVNTNPSPIEDALKSLNLDLTTKANIFNNKDPFVVSNKDPEKAEKDFDNYDNYLHLFPDVNELKDYTKYGVDVTSFNDYNKERALAQTRMEQVSHSLKQMAATIAGEAVSGFGSIYEIFDNIIEEATGGDADFSNEVMRLGANLQESVKESNPIYRENPNKAFDIGDFAWWADNAPSVASSIGMLIPAYSTVGLISKLGKIGKLAKAGDAVNDLSKIIAINDKTGDAIKYWSNLTGTAAIMRNAENLKESMMVHNSVLNEASNLYLGMSDEEFNANMQSNPKLLEEYNKSSNKPLTKENISQFIASKAGWRDYRDNAANIIFDMAQLAPLFRGFKTNAKTLLNKSSIVNENRLVSGLDKMSKTKSLLNNVAYQVAKASPMEITTEGIEELVNAIGEKEGMHYGKYLMGKEKDSEYTNRLRSYLKDPHVWEQGFWGAIGGGVFAGGARGINNLRSVLTDQDDTHSTKNRLLEIQGRSVTLGKTFGNLSNLNKGINPFSDTQSEPLSEQEIQDVHDKIVEEDGKDLARTAIKHGNQNLLVNQLKTKEFRENMASKGDMSIEEVNKISDDLIKVVNNYDKAYDAAVQRFQTADIPDNIKPILINTLTENSYTLNKVTEERNNSAVKLSELRNNNINKALENNIVEKGLNPNDLLDLTSLEVLKESAKSELSKTKDEEHTKNLKSLIDETDTRIKEVKDRLKDNENFKDIDTESLFSPSVVEENANRLIYDIKSKQLETGIDDLSKNYKSEVDQISNKFEEAKTWMEGEFKTIVNDISEAKDEESINKALEELDKLAFDKENKFVSQFIDEARETAEFSKRRLKEVADKVSSNVETEVETEDISNDIEQVNETSEDENESNSFFTGNTNLSKEDKEKLDKHLLNLYNAYNSNNFYSNVTDIGSIKTLYDKINDYITEVESVLTKLNVPINGNTILAFIVGSNKDIASDTNFVDFIKSIIDRKYKVILQVQEEVISSENVTDNSVVSVYLSTLYNLNSDTKLTPEELKIYNTVVNELDIDSEVNINIDTELEDDSDGDINKKHIGLYYKGVKFGHIMRIFSKGSNLITFHKGLVYGGNLGWVNELLRLINSNNFNPELKLLFELKSDSNNEKLLEVLRANKNILSLISFNNDRYADFTVEQLNEAINHIARVVTLRQKNINVSSIIESVKQWDNTINSDMKQSQAIRSQLITNAKLKTKVTYKTPGGIANTGTLRPLNEVFGETTSDFNIPLLYWSSPSNKSTLTVTNSSTSGNNTIFINPEGKDYSFGVRTIIKLAKVNGITVQKPVNLKIMTVGGNMGMLQSITDALFTYAKNKDAGLRSRLKSDIIIETKGEDIILNIDSQEISNIPDIIGTQVKLNIQYQDGKLQSYSITYNTLKGGTTVTNNQGVLRSILSGLKRNINFSNLKSNEPFTDLQGNKFNNYTEYLVKSNAVMSDHYSVRDIKGKLISNTHPDSDNGFSHKLIIKVDSKITKVRTKKPRKERILDLEQTKTTDTDLTNVQTIVDSIAKDNPYKRVFDLLNALNISFNPNYIKGLKGYAAYNNKTRVVSISDKFEYLPDIEKIKLLAHESIHYIVNPIATKEDLDKLKKIALKFKEYLDNPNFISKFSKDEIQRLQSISDIIIDKPIELMTYAFSNETFAKALTSIETVNNDNIITTLAKELYNVIVGLINKLTNDSNMLLDVTNILDEMLVRNDMTDLVNRIDDDFIEVIDKDNKVKYQLKAVNILLSDKAKQVFDKGNKNGWGLDKILQELQIPKEQKQLLLDIGIKDREQLVVELTSKYSYSVEINTGKSDFKRKAVDQVTGEEYIDDSEATGGNSSYYSNLTVPGGTNYTENEISTPLITPSIKGHAQFSTDNGIGWFRSDDTLNVAGDNGEIEHITKAYKEGNISKEIYNNAIKELGSYNPTKTRRVLEIQSDLFQKGRDKDNLIDKNDISKSGTLLKNNKFQYKGETYSIERGDYYKGNEEIEEDEFFKTLKQAEKEFKTPNIDTKENQFLQLLNKDNNWVTFFIKSIIQDSAKKGYEKVLFPKGETAAKIEGHETIANEIKQINKNLQELKDARDSDTYSFQVPTGKLIMVNTKEKYQQEIDKEIERFEQKKSELKSQGIEKLKPIEAFYEIKIGNILEKQFGKDNVKTITDEFGNQWREIVLTPTLIDEISLSEVVDITIKNIDSDFGDTNYINTSLSGSVIDFMRTSDKQTRDGLRHLINTNRIKFHCK